MSANVYELMFLLDTGKMAGDIQGTAKQLHDTFEKHQAEVLASRPWDERKLAYPIKGQKKGLYYLTYIRAESTKLVEIQADLTLNETVLRNMTMRIDPKLVDTMLALAQDETALALQSVSEEAAAEDANLGDGPPRRGRKSDD